MDELGSLIATWGFPRLHAKRILRLYYDAAGRPTFEGTSIPLRLLERLREIPLLNSRITTSQQSEDSTQKLLLTYPDGASVESVLMPDLRPDRSAGCLSTQVGCAIGCAFCATGTQGFTRNLSAGQIVASGDKELALHLEEKGYGWVVGKPAQAAGA